MSTRRLLGMSRFWPDPLDDPKDPPRDEHKRKVLEEWIDGRVVPELAHLVPNTHQLPTH